MNTTQIEVREQTRTVIEYPDYWIGLKQRKAQKGYDNFNWEQEPLRSELKKLGVIKIQTCTRLYHHSYTISEYWLFGGDIKNVAQILNRFVEKYKIQIYKRPGL